VQADREYAEWQKKPSVKKPGLTHLLRKSGMEHFLRHSKYGIKAVTRRNPNEAKQNERTEVVVVRNQHKMALTGTIGNMREQAENWLVEETNGIRGEYRNNHTGFMLVVARKGLKEAASHAHGEPELQAITALPQLIKHAVLFDVSPHEPTKKDFGDVYTFYGILKQNGRVLLIKIVAKQIQKRKLAYDQQSVEIVTPGVIQAASDPMHRDQALTPPPGVNSVISLHQLVDYVNTMHPEHIESFHRLHKPIKPQPQNDRHKSIQHLPTLIKSRKLDGSIDFNGLQISIETGRSRCREWHNPHDGTQGMSRMTLPYGYIKRSLGVDGDHYDVFVGQDREAANVYIITTMKAPDFTEVDEQKAVLGVATAEEAKRVFAASYDDPRFFGSMTEMPFAEFKEQVLATKNTPRMLGGELA
jgi:Inorganic Pyrophosphatase/Large polyvalent protein-associated domain 3